MAYDEVLAGRIRALMAGDSSVTERAMFGGMAFLVAGSLAFSVQGGGGLLVRVDPAEYASLVDSPGAEVARMGERTMHGWLLVAADSLTTDAQLTTWVQRGIAYARSSGS